MRRRKKEDGDTGSPAEGGSPRRESPPTPEASAEASSPSQWSLCSCQTVAVVFGGIALVSFFFGRHLFPLIAEDIAVLKGTEKAEPPPVHEDVMELFRVFDLFPDGKIDPVEFDHIARFLPKRREVGLFDLLSLHCIIVCTYAYSGQNHNLSVPTFLYSETVLCAAS